ncbi:MAG: glycosyltransferase [Rubrivivax sp.]
MHGEQPQVSVVMSVHDGARFLAPAVLGILGQTLQALEFIVVDDGSQDDSGAMLERVAACDPRLRLFRRPHAGLVGSLNFGCAQARGRYLARMDADDIALPTRLAQQVAHLEAHPSLGVLGCAVEFIDAQDRPLPVERTLLGHARLMRALLAGTCPLVHPSVMMRRVLFEAVGGYRPGVPHAEDFDLWLRMGEVGGLDNLPQPLLRYRRHAQQVSIRHFRQQALSNLAARASAQARRSGRPDPLDGAVALDEQVLEALGITPPQQARAFARAALTSIRSLGDAGDIGAARSLLQALREADARQPLAPDQRADLRLAQARLDWQTGHPLQAAGACWRALLGRPRLALRPLKHRWGLGPHSP